MASLSGCLKVTWCPESTRSWRSVTASPKGSTILDPGGGYRGWADRVAGALSAQRPGFRYANLAIRGKLLCEVVAEQLPRAVELAPDLVSLAAGGNDILRGSDVDVLAAEFEPAVAKLQAAGCRVLIFTGFDPRMFPVIRLLRGRIAAYNMHLRGIADACGCDLVDLWSMRVLKDPRAWSPDRLHLTTEGHRRVALRACEVLGVPVAEDWRAPLLPEPCRRPGRPPYAPGGRRTGPAAAAVAGRPSPGRPLGARVRGPVGAPEVRRHVQRRRRAAQAPRPAPRLVRRPAIPGWLYPAGHVRPRRQPVRSARTSSRRASDAAIQGSEHGSAEFSAAVRSLPVSP